MLKTEKSDIITRARVNGFRRKKEGWIDGRTWGKEITVSKKMDNMTEEIRKFIKDKKRNCSKGRRIKDTKMIELIEQRTR